MICALTARRIAGGKTEEFLDAFTGAGDEMPEEIRERFKAIYACRDISDPDVILTFGLFDGSLDQFREMQGGGDREQQLEAMSPLIEETLFDSSFEVLHEFIGEGQPAHH